MTGRDESKRTVLVCDDELDILTVFSEALKPEFRVLTAESGLECIRTVAEEKRNGNKIDILILDYRLGDMFGDKVAIEVRRIGSTKIVLMTAYDRDSREVEEMKRNELIEFVVTKPVSLRELIPKLKAIY